MQPKKFSEYTPITLTDGNEILPIVKVGANTTVRIKNLGVSIPTQAAIDVSSGQAASSIAAHTNNVTNPHAVTKTQVGLGNAENTADLAKPVSTAAQIALDNKQPLNANLTAIVSLTPANDDIIQRKSGAWVNRTPAEFKTDLVLVKGDVGLPNVDNTSDVNKPISTAGQAALNLKLNLIGGTIQPTANSATTLSIKNADGTKNLLIADTTNVRVIFGNAGGDQSQVLSIGNEVAIGSYFGHLRIRATNANKVMEFRKQDDTGSLASINIDTGAASFSTGSFSGLVTAGTAPTASGHLTPKSYVDAGDAAIIAQKGAVSGIAPLGADSKIASAYLPSYVDDVLEVANLAALPATGETGKIYVTLDTNYEYRWGGSSYIRLVASPGSTDAVPEGSTNLYFTTARASAAAPVQTVAGRIGAITLTQSDIANLSTDLAAKIIIGGDLSGTPTVPLLKNSRKIFNAADYGAKNDGIVLTNGVIAVGALSVLTSATAAFVAADVGKTIMVRGAFTSGTTLVTTIASLNSATSVNLTLAATAAVTNANVQYGTNNNTAFAAWINALNANTLTSGIGAAAYARGGRYIYTTRFPAPLSGTAWYGDSYQTIFVGGGQFDYGFVTGYGASGPSNPVTNYYQEGIIWDTNFLYNASGLSTDYISNSIFNKVAAKNVAAGGWNWKMGIRDAATDEYLNRNIKLIDCEFDYHSGSLEMLLLFNTIDVDIIRPRFTNNSGGPCVGLWQKAFNINFIDPVWRDNQAALYYSYSCGNIALINPRLYNSGSISGANTSDYGAFGYTNVDGIQIINPVMIGGANSTQTSGIQMGSVRNFLITNPYITKYQTGISLNSREIGISGVLGDTTRYGDITNPQIFNNNASNNFSILHPGIAFGNGADYITIMGGHIYDNRATKQQKYPLSFGDTTYNNITVIGVNLEADTSANASSIGLHDGGAWGTTNILTDNRNFSTYGSSPTQILSSAPIINSRLNTMPANTFKANNTGSAANPADITVVQAKTLLAITEADVAGLVADLAAKEPSVIAGTSAQYYRGDKTFQTLNTTAITEGTNLYYTNARADARIAAQRGVASGIASLDASGLIPSSQLPSFVDDVIESANFAAFPVTGEASKIYVTLDTNKTYRWGGSAYVAISASPGSTDSVTEGSTNLYFTNERAQDAVGSVLIDSATIDFTYDDPGNNISATVIQSALNRNLLGGGALTIANGGTEATTAAGARTNLGLAIGSNVQAWDVDLDALAALTTTGSIHRTGAGTVAVRTLTAGSTKLTITNGDGVAGNPTVDVATGNIDHNALINLAAGDVHTQYALLAGRSGNQTFIGSTAPGGNLTLLSTSHATKGKIFLGTAAVYDQVNDRLGIGTTSPTDGIQIDAGGLTRGIKFGDSQTIRGNYGHGEQLLGFANKQYRWLGSDSTTHFVIHNDMGWISIDRGTNTATTGIEVNGGAKFTGSLTVATTSNPGAPTVVTQGAVGAVSYGYAIVANTATGASAVSGTTTLATGNATLNATNFNRITWARVDGAISYGIYRVTSAGTPATTGLIGTFDVRNSLTLQFDDTGLAGNGFTAPVGNTTGRSGFGVTSPTAYGHFAAATAAAASMRIPTGTAPTTPNDGDIWYDGTNLLMRVGGVNKTFTLV